MPENPLRNNPHRRWLEKSLCFLRSIPRFQFMPQRSHLLSPAFTFIHFNFTDVAVISMYGRKSLPWFCQHQPILSQLVVEWSSIQHRHHHPHHHHYHHHHHNHYHSHNRPNPHQNADQARSSITGTPLANFIRQHLDLQHHHRLLHQLQYQNIIYGIHMKYI